MPQLLFLMLFSIVPYVLLNESQRTTSTLDHLQFVFGVFSLPQVLPDLTNISFGVCYFYRFAIRFDILEFHFRKVITRDYKA